VGVQTPIKIVVSGIIGRPKKLMNVDNVKIPRLALELRQEL